MDYENDVADVITAFLLSPLKEDVYIEIPDGFSNLFPQIIKDKNSQELVLKLKKGLYGLLQAPLGWNTEMDLYLVSIGYKSTITDPCFYFRASDSTYLLVWVDNFIVAAQTSILVASIKKTIASKFPLKDRGLFLLT